MRPQTEAKNILFSHSQYGEHWIIGFFYKRAECDRASKDRIYSFDTLEQVAVPLKDVEVFM